MDLKTFGKNHRDLEREAFIERFPNPFLLRAGTTLGDQARQVYPLDHETLRVGRDTRSEITIPHSSVSKVHALLTRVEGGWEVEDKNSTNGTYLDGQRLAAGQRARLDQHSVVRFGITSFALITPERLHHLLGSVGPEWDKDSDSNFGELDDHETERFRPADTAHLVTRSDLAKTSLIQVLWNVEAKQSTGRVTILAKDGEQGEIWFGAGLPCQASTSRGELKGIPALHFLVQVHEGSMIVEMLETVEERRISGTFSQLLFGQAWAQWRQEREAAEARLHAIVDNVFHAIVTVNGSGRIETVNPAAVALFGRTAEDIVGAPIEQICASGGGLERIRAGVGQVQELVGTREGQDFPLEMAVGFRRLGDRDLFILTFRDLSQRKKEEATLQIAQKMEAVGRLSGGMTHDFNNLLTVISGYAELLLEGRASPETCATAILAATKRSMELTRKLLATTRLEQASPVALDLNKVVVELEVLLRGLLGEDGQLELDLAEDLPCVLFDRSQFEQVVVNLAFNAREATEGPCKVLIRTEVLGPRSVRIVVRDEGSGIDAETLPRVFEPFFTTKKTGTGLGLSVVYGIVTQSGGKVDITSGVDAGTSVELLLPTTELSAEEEGALAEAAQKPGRILAVEDEGELRELIRLILEGQGHEVTVARDGIEALERYDGHDLVVTDVVMPRLGGVGLVKELLQRQPTQRVLYLSGYRDQALVGGFTLVEKPFSNSRFAEAVWDALR